MIFSQTLTPVENGIVIAAPETLGANALKIAGYQTFDDLWDLPHKFVDDVNYRRNGWSAVSLLTLADSAGGRQKFYVKRQENQLRYSLKHLFGALTFQFEVEALEQISKIGLPGVDLVASGFRTLRGAKQGFIVTQAIANPSFDSFEKNPPDWSNCLPTLRRVGEQLLEMHGAGWQHGALYPAHLFVDRETGLINLIDFERARRSSSQVSAAEADFSQFLKRSAWLPDQALEALLHHHTLAMPDLILRLTRKFPNRFNLAKE